MEIYLILSCTIYEKKRTLYSVVCGKFFLIAIYAVVNVNGPFYPMVFWPRYALKLHTAALNVIILLVSLLRRKKGI